MVRLDKSVFLPLLASGFFPAIVFSAVGVLVVVAGLSVAFLNWVILLVSGCRSVAGVTVKLAALAVVEIGCGVLPAVVS